MEKVTERIGYLNPVALLYLLATQLTRILIAGRAFGKSFLLGVIAMTKVATLPRSVGLLIAPTYTTVLTKILPPMKSAWGWMGYYEGRHYVVGKKPPEWFKSPYQKPDKYENVVSWWNGTVMVFASIDRPNLIRGGSYDWFLGDEMLMVPESDYSNIIVPTKRPSHLMLKGKSGMLTQDLMSSMPFKHTGRWILEKEILATNPDNNIFYIEGTSWDNVEVIGEDTILDWKKTMSPVSYLIEVMNKRMTQLETQFYPALTDKHWYTDSYDYSYIDNLGNNLANAKKDSRWDKDCDPNEPITISHDWGAFNTITIRQHSLAPYFINERFTIPANTVRFINHMYTIHPRLVSDLANDFCGYYKHHKNKRVFQMGDKSGNDRQANSKETLFQEFAQILKKNGWYVIKGRTGDAEHLARHNFINKLHRGDEYPTLPMVMYNLNNCKDLRIALESTPMRDGKKDKSSESNPNVKPYHATHNTDAHDYDLWFSFHPGTIAKQYTSKVSFGN